MIDRRIRDATAFIIGAGADSCRFLGNYYRNAWANSVHMARFRMASASANVDCESVFPATILGNGRRFLLKYLYQRGSAGIEILNEHIEGRCRGDRSSFRGEP